MTTLTNFLNKYLEVHGEFPNDFAKLIKLDEQVSYKETYNMGTASSYPHVYDVKHNVVESIIYDIPEEKIKPLITPEWFITKNIDSNNMSIFNKAFLKGYVGVASDILDCYLKNSKEYDYFTIYTICNDTLESFSQLNRCYSQLDIATQNKAKDLLDRIIELAYECREKSIMMADKRRKPKFVDLTQLLTMSINKTENDKKMYQLNFHAGKQLIDTMFDTKGTVFFDYLWNKLDEPRKKALLTHNKSACEKYHLYEYSHFDSRRDTHSFMELIIHRGHTNIYEYLQKKGYTLKDTELDENKFLEKFMEARENILKSLFEHISSGRYEHYDNEEKRNKFDLSNSNKLLELVEKDFQTIPEIKINLQHRANIIFLNLVDDSKPLTKYDSTYNKSTKLEIDDKKLQINNEQIKLFFAMKKDFMNEFKNEFESNKNSQSNNIKNPLEAIVGLEQIKNLDKINLKPQERDEVEKIIFPQLIQNSLKYKIKEDKLKSLLELFYIKLKNPDLDKENPKKTIKI